MGEVHFGKRFKKLREELWEVGGKPGSQAQAAEFFHKRGVLRAPNQTAISRWEGKRVFSENLLGKFEVLRELGVNIDFLRYSHVTDWRAEAAPVVSETELIRLRQRLLEVSEEARQLKKVNQELIDLLQKLREEDAD